MNRTAAAERLQRTAWCRGCPLRAALQHEGTIVCSAEPPRKPRARRRAGRHARPTRLVLTAARICIRRQHQHQPLSLSADCKLAGMKADMLAQSQLLLLLLLGLPF